MSAACYSLSSVGFATSKFVMLPRLAHSSGRLTPPCSSPDRPQSVVAIATLLGFCAALTIFGAFVLGFGPLHFDMTETYAWGKEFQLGYIKHPPFAPWLAGLWFMAMPRVDWSFYLLASINAGIGLAGIWRLTGLFLPAAGRWAVVLILVLTPSFTLWALKFNVNAPLLSTWPWTAYFFLQSLQSRGKTHAALAGALAAMAMLTKYSSIVLLATLLLVAVMHPQRRQYFSSRAPYVTVLVGALLIAPHVWWMVTSGFPTVEYAVSKTHYPLAQAQEHTLLSVLASIAALGVGAAACTLAFGANSWSMLKTFAASLREKSAWWVLVLALGPFALTIAGYFLANLRVSGGYLIPVYFLLPLAFLVLSHAQVTSVVLRRLALYVGAVWLPLLMASPLLGYYAFTRADPSWVEPRREIAVSATRMWRAATGRPLKKVSGFAPLATAAVFYSPDAPSYVALDVPAGSPWAAAAAIERDGLLIICHATDTACITTGRKSVGSDPLSYADDFAASYFGWTAAPQRFVFFLVPPKGATVVWD